jgi:surface antigen
MKKTTFKVGLFLCALTFISTASASAAFAKDTSLTNKFLGSVSAFEYHTATSGAKLKPTEEKKIAEKPVAAEPSPSQHTIAEGESLTIVAQKYASTWTRLFAKNIQIADPNIIKVGEKITIPEATEQLPERPLPPQPQAVAPTQPAGQSNTDNAPAYSGNSAGNTYSPGYCTWYAKNRRPDLPNSLGNADTWVYRAQAMGIATGSAPRTGAIGQQGMHVVFVESVNGDGTVTISEMNYQGLYITSSRTVPAGNFMYIY